MKIDDFIDKYDDEYFAGEVYGEFAYTRETVKQMLKDLLELAAENAKMTTVRYVKGQDNRGNIYGFEEIVDKKSILNVLEE